MSGRPADAERFFREALRLQPVFGPALIGLSEAQFQQGKAAESSASLRRAIAEGAGDWFVQRAWARYQVRKKHLAVAETAYRTALRLGPNSDTYIELGDLYLIGLSKPREAADAYRAALAMDPVSAPARQALATALAAIGQTEASREAFRETARLAPNDPYVLLARGLEQQRRGEPEAALVTFSDCIARHTAFVPALLARGNLHASRNDYPSALTDFSAALKLVPQSGQIHTAVGMLQLRSNLTGLAEAAFLNAIRFDSGQADAYNNLAWLTSERKTRTGLNDALAWAKKAVALHPKRATYLDTLATVYGARGELDAAIAAQEKAVSLLPQDAELVNHLSALRDRKRTGK